MNRRKLLKSTGVALALPLLEIHRTANAAAFTPRMLNICNTLGLYAASWVPATAGRDYPAGEYLSITDRHRAKYTIVSGLSHKEQTGRQAHNSEITWLTSAKHPGMDGFQNTVSIDQIAANQLGYTTRFPSITLGTTSAQSQSYTTNGVMLPASTSPASLFEAMFLSGDPRAVARERRRIQAGGSILDELKAQTRSLAKDASTADQRSLDAYFDAVRIAERDLTEVAAWMDRPKPQVTAPQPNDVSDNADLIGRIRLWFDLIPLALVTDSTRVASLMIQDHGVVPKVDGVLADQHSLSHHGQDESKIVQLRKIEREIMVAFDKLLATLGEQSDAGGSLLDQTAVLFGSNLGNANSHEARNLPIMVAGGSFNHGGHVAFDAKDNAPLSNLFVTLLRYMGVDTDQFGQSTEALRLA